MTKSITRVLDWKIGNEKRKPRQIICLLLPDVDNLLSPVAVAIARRDAHAMSGNGMMDGDSEAGDA